jgi:hypothetical protein
MCSKLRATRVSHETTRAALGDHLKHRMIDAMGILQQLSNSEKMPTAQNRIQKSRGKTKIRDQ